MRSPDQIGITWEENASLKEKLKAKVELEHRRANNIFEMGDIAVGKDYDDFDDALLTITEKFNHFGKPCVVFECEKTICDDFESELRHATDAEIKARCRLQ